MALLFTDGFDIGDYGIKYSGFSDFGFMSSSTTTRYSTGRSIAGGSSTRFLLLPLPASNKIIIGFALKDTLSANRPLVEFLGDARATTHIRVQINTTRTISILRGTSTVLATSTATVDTNWHYIEASATISDTVGVVDVHVDGVQVVTFTGDTKNAGTATTIDGLNVYVGGGQIYDDMYVCDDTGTTNNAFLGEVRIQTLSPSGAGSVTQWTPDTGSNYARVNEIPYSTANYVSSSTVGQQDLYAMGDLLAGTASVYGIQTCIIGSKSDAGAANVKSIIKSGGTVYSDPSVQLNASSVHFYRVRETNPATSTAWTVTNVNSLEAGVEVT